MKAEIRNSRSDDNDAILALYPQAFPDEDLVPLVTTLLLEGPTVHSFVALEQEAIVANVIFTLCSVEGSADKLALLGPLAVHPKWQRQGIGSQIMRAGLHEMEMNGVACIFVLGDPAYYGRFGFARETQVTPPYTLPGEWEGAWQSLALGAKKPSCAGRLCVPEPWRKRELWAP